MTRPVAQALAALVAAALVGVVGGLAWTGLAPVVRLQRVPGGVLLDETSGARLFAAEGWFAVIALVGGALLGAAAVRLATRVGWVSVPVAAVLALGAGVLAWRLAVALDGGPVGGGTSGSVAAPLSLSGRSALALWPLGTGLVAVAAAVLRPRWFDRARRAGSLRSSVGAPPGRGDVGGRQ